MNQTSRCGWVGLLFAGTLSVAGLSGCSSSGGADEGKVFGQMGLPLTTQGASGVSYRLRDATFVVQSNNYYGTAGALGTAGSGPSAGTGGGPGTVIVSSETDPDATNISLSLEEGYYNVHLLPGWHMEKLTTTGSEPVETTLLTGETQWVYVSRQYTSWAEFSFGVGGREIWLNGQLNIGIDVQETPGGSAGWGNTGGWNSGGWSSGGTSSGGSSFAGAPSSAGAAAQ